MVKPDPPATLVMIESQLILHLLEISLDAPADLRQANQIIATGMFGKGGQPVFRRLGLGLRPFDQEPFGTSRFAPLVVTMRGPHPNSRESGLHGATGPLSPTNRTPTTRGKSVSQFAGGKRLVSGRPANPRRRSSSPGPTLWRERCLPGRPHARLGGDADDIGHPALCQTFSKRSHDTVARVGDDRSFGQILRQHPIHRRECDLPLCRESHILRNPGNPATLRIPSPRIWKIKPIGARDAHRGIGQRHGHRDLAVVLLAQRTAVLPRHADRMRSLLGNAGVVHDPSSRRGMSLELCQGVVSCTCQQFGVIPWRGRDKVVHRLVPSRNVSRINLRGHRLHALSLPRQQESSQIRSQRGDSISVSHGTTQACNVRIETSGWRNVSLGHGRIVPRSSEPVNL